MQRSEKHDPKQVGYWILSNAKDVQHGGVEYNFPCPYCGHKAHYFNVKKGIGFCHAARCKRVTTIEALEQVFGNTPDSVVVGYVGDEQEADLIEEAPIALPVAAVPLVFRQTGSLVTHYPEVVTKLQETRFINPEQAHRWAILFDPASERVIVPVYAEGRLENYVSRAVWWKPSATDYKRYDYPHGRNIKKWLYGWAEAKQLVRISLVENTFNSIWLRNSLGAVSVFGSDLSQQQVNLIFKSKVQQVTFMFDWGAEERAQKSLHRLSKVGVDCRIVRFTEAKQQPDSYTEEELIAMADHVWRL